MTMMNDNESFIREVNEELRSEQLRTIWKRFKPIIIGVAVLVVLGVIAYQAYEHWEQSNKNASGDRFLAALQSADQNRKDEATKQLQALSQDGFGSYPVLARMRLAAMKAENGDTAGAVSDFSAIGKDDAVPPAIRNVARLRAAWMLVDGGKYDQVASEVEEFAVPSSPMRHSAREVLGLAAWKAGDYAKARDWFQLIVDDADAPSGVVQRARTMLSLITASGKLSNS